MRELQKTSYEKDLWSERANVCKFEELIQLPVTNWMKTQTKACHTEAANARDKKKPLKASRKVRGWSNIRIRPGSGTEIYSSSSKNTRQPRIYGTFSFKGTNPIAIPHGEFSEKTPIDSVSHKCLPWIQTTMAKKSNLESKKDVSYFFFFLSTEAQYDTFEN